MGENGYKKIEEGGSKGMGKKRMMDTTHGNP